MGPYGSGEPRSGQAESPWCRLGASSGSMFVTWRASSTAINRESDEEKVRMKKKDPVKPYAQTLVEIFNPTGESLAAEFWTTKKGKAEGGVPRSGFSPICGNKFDRSAGCRLGQGGACQHCPQKEHLPLTADVVETHIRGKRPKDKRGIFPMLPGDLTAWVAADLDNHDGTKDPAADLEKIVQMARSLSIPLSIFSSSSGKGFHVYLFFEEPVPAGKARNLLLSFLKWTKVDISHRLDKLGSFDCVFPKQDKLKSGEIGNLIALPYFGQAMKDRNATLLIDPDTVEAFGQDWEENLNFFVERLQKIPEAMVDTLHGEMGVLQEKRGSDAVRAMRGSIPDLPSRMMECGFLSHCVEDASTLSEPDWYLMICILAREYGGPALIHEISKPYPDYSQEETQAKISHALMDQPGPITCRRIKESYDCGRDCGVPTPLSLLRQTRGQGCDLDEEEIEAALSGFLKDAEEGDTEAPFSASPLLARLPKRQDIKWRLRFKNALGSKLNLNFLAGAIKGEHRSAGKINWEEENDPSDLPRINVGLGQMRILSAVALNALKASNDPPYLFVRGGELVRIRTNERGEPFIEALSESALRGHLARAANWVMIKKEEPVAVPPPMELVRDILSLPSWDFSPLDAIIETPTLRPDGSILSQPGYDAHTHLYYFETPGFSIPQLPIEPTREDAKSAAEFFLREVLCDFPFADETSRANVLGLMLTALVRHAIHGKVPLALIDAPQAGTGKSLLAEVISMVATGRPSPMTTAPINRMGSDDEEWRKRIKAILLAGTGLVIIDNVEGILESPSLAAALTVDTWSDRILGRSEQVVLPQRATWMATGNNIKLGGDLPRRCYWVRLDAKMARPWERSGYRHTDLTSWVAENRGDLVASLLCMARAWFVAGKPSPGILEIGGFESWTRTIGGVLEFAGVAGFLANLHELYDSSDDVSQQWQAFLESWHDSYGSRPITVNEFTDDISCPIDDYTPREKAARVRALRETLPERLPESFSRSLGSFKVALGKALSKRAGVRFPNMLHLERASDESHTKVARWKVVRTCHGDSCGGISPELDGGKLVDFPSQRVVPAGDAGEDSQPSHVATTPSRRRNQVNGKGGFQGIKRHGESPAFPAVSMKDGGSQGPTAAGEPNTEREGMIRCGDCSHFDGIWCQAPISWDRKRGQDANGLHEKSTHCNEGKKGKSIRGIS